MQDTLKDGKKACADAVEAMKRKLAGIRTGRASLSLIEHIEVEAYDSTTPLNQLATLAVADATLLTAQPWDAGVIKSIEDAIRSADLGLNPVNDGKLIRIPVPPLTEERRKEFAKKVHAMGEEFKNEVRQIRRDMREEIKLLKEEKEVSEDEMHRGFDEVQKLHDDFIKQVDALVAQKEEEIMTV